MTPALTALLAATEALHRVTPALQDFAPWPDDLRPGVQAPKPIPALPLIEGFSHPTGPGTAPIIGALRAFAPEGHWKRTYSEAEVGADFRARYGYLELYGPTGMARSDTARAYIAYWGAGLDYDWHHHEAEELYFILGGNARFFAKHQPDATLSPGDTRQHGPDEPHAMSTRGAPVLAYVLWRGQGLSGLPQMGGKA